MAKQEGHAPGFVPALGRLDATALVAGSMVGSGIFIVPAEIMRRVQAPGLLLAVWILAGILTILGALTYGELAAMFPRAGGQYVYLREGLSPLFGYLYGWTLFTVIQTGAIAAVAVAFARFSAVFFPAISGDVHFGATLALPSGAITLGLSPQRALAVSAVVLLTWINVRGVRAAAALQTTITIVKVGALLGLVGVGLVFGRHADAIRQNFGPAFGPSGGLGGACLPALGAAMVGALFSMDAWNNVGFAAGELARPRRDLPFAMIAGVLLVTGLYLLANVTYLLVLPASAIAHAAEDRVGTAALEASVGGVGLYLMAAAIVVSALGCINGLVLSGARVYYAMAHDGLFFKSAGAVHPRYRTPAVALIVQAAWASVLCLTGTFSQLLDYVIFASLIFYALTAAGLFVLRIRRPADERPVRVPGYPWLPAMYVVLNVVIAGNLLVHQPGYTIPGLVLVASGVPAYFAWRWRARRLAG
jgi:APA family basic amino acid/polyamine antiporter